MGGRAPIRCDRTPDRHDEARTISVVQLGVVSNEELRDLYWSTATFAFPQTNERVILPRQWVGDSQLFGLLGAELDPARLAELDARRGEFDPEPTLEKCVAEAIYETVRQRLLPDAPSRLDCLFAALNVNGALEFAARYGPPLVFDEKGMSTSGVVPVATADGCWVALDMHLFDIPQAIGPDEAANAQELHRLSAEAERYWRGEQSDTVFVEVLAEKLWQWTAFISDGHPPPPYAQWRATRG